MTPSGTPPPPAPDTPRPIGGGPLPLPARAGVGLKPAHYHDILAERPDIGFFEVHAENYMGAGGPPHRYLTAIREDYPLSVHGVGLSIGGAGPLDALHLERLAGVVERYQPGLVSEHLAWSSHGGAFFNDLLPLPLNETTLTIVADHVDQVQERLQRRILIENPATYVEFAATDLSETEFLRELARRTGCGLLLDVNNVHVSTTNHGGEAGAYIDRFPFEHVEEIHLAGHAVNADEAGAPLLIDSHDREIVDPVWKLYERALALAGPLPTLIEWDNDLPDWPRLHSEARRAEARLDQAAATFRTRARPDLQPVTAEKTRHAVGG